jgi:hypothetical protein
LLDFGKVRAWSTEKLAKNLQDWFGSPQYYCLLAYVALILWKQIFREYSDSRSFLSLKQIRYVISLSPTKARTVERELSRLAEYHALERKVMKEPRRLGRPKAGYEKRRGRPYYGYRLAAMPSQETFDRAQPESGMIDRVTPGVVSAILRLARTDSGKRMAPRALFSILRVIERTYHLILAKNNDPKMVTRNIRSHVRNFFAMHGHPRKISDSDFSVFDNITKTRVRLSREMTKKARAKSLRVLADFQERSESDGQ